MLKVLEQQEITLNLIREDVDFLLKINDDLVKKNTFTGSTDPVEIKPVRPPLYLLKFNWIAGSLNLPCGIKIEVYPHLGDRNSDPTGFKERAIIFLNMFLKVYGIHKKLESVLENFPSTGADLPGIESLLAQIYIKLLSETLQKEGQLPRNYVPEEKTESRIRGKILFRRDIPLELKVPHIYQKIYSRSPMTDLNLMLYQALKLARQENDLERQTRSTSLNLENEYFGFVNFTPSFKGRTSFILSQIKNNRLYRNFLLPAIVARMLIENTISSPYGYKKLGTAFLINTPELFEKYITLLLEEVLSEKIKSGEVEFRSQSSKAGGISHHLLKIVNENESTPIYSMTPDNTIRNRKTGETTIIDTKYKIFNSIETDAKKYGEDLYQMYAYARAFKAKKVVLIYPSINEFSRHEAKFFDDSAQLSFLKIPLERPQEHLKEVLA